MHRLLVLVVLALMLPTAGGAAGGSGSSVLVERARILGSGQMLHVGSASPDGSVFVDLTGPVLPPDWTAEDAAWSPDGSRIVFAAGPAGTAGLPDLDLFTIAAGGGDLRRLTTDGLSAGLRNIAPIWSSDGTRIAWVKERHDLAGVVWTMSPDGSDQRAVEAGFPASSAEITDVSWSADGTMLAWTRDDRGARSVWIANRDATGARQVVASAEEPRWQPTGDDLLYSSAHGQAPMSVIDVLTGETVTTATGAVRGVWLPDGTGFVFANSQGDVSISKLDGTVRSLASGAGTPLAWSPDGRELALAKPRYLAEGRTVCPCPDIYVIDADGSHLRDVTNDLPYAVNAASFENVRWWPGGGRLYAYDTIFRRVTATNDDGSCRAWLPLGYGQLPAFAPGAAPQPAVTCVALEVTGGFPDETVSSLRTTHLRFTVYNRGNLTATQPRVDVSVSNGTAAGPASGCTAGRMLRCTLPAIAARSSVSVPVDVAPARRGPYAAKLVFTADGAAPFTERISTEALPCRRTGSEGPDVIEGTPGADSICGFGGRDTIDGRSGDDTIFGGSSSDRLDGGPGSDTIEDVASPDKIDAGPGNDRVIAGGGDVVSGGAGNDWIDVSAPGIDTVDCGTGRDTVVIAWSGTDRHRNCERVIRRRARR